MLTFLGGIAEFERDLIRARTSEGRARQGAFGAELMDTTSIILTSTVIATFLSSAINAVVGHYAKQRDFKNDYYKTIIQRRLQAYEQVEALVVKLKTTQTV